MNHFDEMACMLYLDQQLEPERARELIHHTTTCAPCRALLPFVGSGKRWLRSALTEDLETVPARLIEAPAPLANALGMDYSFRFGGKRLLHFVETSDCALAAAVK